MNRSGLFQVHHQLFVGFHHRVIHNLYRHKDLYISCESQKVGGDQLRRVRRHQVVDLPNVDLRFPDGYREAADDADHPDGLLGRGEESDSFAVQESQAGADRGDADHSILRQRAVVLGDRQLSHAEQKALPGPSSAATVDAAAATRPQHSRESQSQISNECEPSADEETRVGVGPAVVGRRSDHLYSGRPGRPKDPAEEQHRSNLKHRRDSDCLGNNQFLVIFRGLRNDRPIGLSDHPIMINYN